MYVTLSRYVMAPSEVNASWAHRMHHDDDEQQLRKTKVLFDSHYGS